MKPIKTLIHPNKHRPVEKFLSARSILEGYAKTGKANPEELQSALKAFGLKVKDVKQDLRSLVNFLLETNDIKLVESILKNTKPEDIDAVVTTIQKYPWEQKSEHLASSMKSAYYRDNPVGMVKVILKPAGPRATKALKEKEAPFGKDDMSTSKDSPIAGKK